MHCSKPDEALVYLSDALGRCLTSLYRTVVGYQNAYTLIKQYDQGLEISLWLHQLILGLCQPGSVTYFHKADSIVLTTCALFSMYRGDRDSAYNYLREARTTALTFDAAPDYSLNAIRFFHGSKDATAYDDLGETAIDAINRYVKMNSSWIQEIWEEICNEEEQ